MVGIKLIKLNLLPYANSLHTLAIDCAVANMYHNIIPHNLTIVNRKSIRLQKRRPVKTSDQKKEKV